MDVSLSDIGQLNPRSSTLEELARALLGVLETVTRMDSIFLAHFDPRLRALEVVYARHSRRQPIGISEGDVVPWENTVCRRSVEDRVAFTQRADELWSDTAAIPAHGIRTYLGQPMHDAKGELIGTLCAVSRRRVVISEEILRVFGLFSRLIGHQFESQWQLARLRQENQELASRLMIDPLTGIANRRGLLHDLRHALAHAARHGEQVAVAFVDLDRFKVINDQYGHRVGDRFLVTIAARLAAATRAGEKLARYGGDEFVVVTSFAGGGGDPVRLAARFAAATRGRFWLGETEIDYAGASVGTAMAEPGEDAETLLHRADAVMYGVKQETYRRAAACDVERGAGHGRKRGHAA